MLSSTFRGYANIFIVPVARVFSRIGIHPNSITFLGLASAAAAGHFYRLQDLYSAMVFLVLMSIFDVLDGAVAREMDMVTDFGGFLDSVMDRYSDAIILLGIAMYLGGYYPLVIITLLGFFMVSYTRARGENIIEGKCDVGLAERAERLIVIVIATMVEIWGGLGFGTAFLYALVLLAALTHLTALQRVMYTRRMS